MLNRANLIKLAEYLDTLPDDYMSFSMDVFLTAANSLRDALPTSRSRDYALHNGGVGECGAVACAVGHGPAAGILFDNDPSLFFPESGRPDWDAYIDRYLIDDYKAYTPEASKAFDWMFGGSWHSIDNTPSGAAARIRYLLDGKPIPANSDPEIEYFNPDISYVGLYHAGA